MARSNCDQGCWPDDVGILAMEVYFPYMYVDQSELEQYDGVSAGKYTIGLGQAKMGFCSDNEDVYSLCLTVTRRLMERNGIAYDSVGRVDVGTETILDKSKSVKSVMMQLFEENGNTDMEGVDNLNACYGGTAALFNCVSWIESSAWDGRYALLVAGDIAVYASGPARPTGGAGAVALLIGPNAPLVLERGLRASHMRHVYDFYKPDLLSEYPVVDGKLSVECYLSALDKCYERYSSKLTQMKKSGGEALAVTLDDFDFLAFHSPYCKLVRKSVGRLMLNDFVRHTDIHPERYTNIKILNVKLEETYHSREIEQDFVKASTDVYEVKVKPGLLLANQVGNMYAPSVFAAVASILSIVPMEQLLCKRIGVFSYGSGMASSMYSIRVSADGRPDGPLTKLIHNLATFTERLEQRVQVPPHQYEQMLKIREKTHHLGDYTPVGSSDSLFAGTYYLTYVDSKYRRQYNITDIENVNNGIQSKVDTVVSSAC